MNDRKKTYICERGDGKRQTNERKKKKTPNAFLAMHIQSDFLLDLSVYGPQDILMPPNAPCWLVATANTRSNNKYTNIFVCHLLYAHTYFTQYFLGRRLHFFLSLFSFSQSSE